MTERWIQWVLAHYHSSPVSAARQLLLVPNCNNHPAHGEADLLAVSKAGYCTEVEIKISLSDWKRDQDKYKHRAHIDDRYNVIRRFYYAGPMALMKRYAEVWTAPGSGVIGIEYKPHAWPRRPVIEVLRPAELKRVRKLTDQEVIRVARTCMFRYWTWAARANEPSNEPDRGENEKI